ncbi:MAG: polyprenyl diphosphate synthase [Proteobacteria bacterium]|nr:polyprenyl diphosphate synthase [Pseudomonadota bacterium]
MPDERKNNQQIMKIKHIAIIMDGNGRWATQRKRPRTFGHQAGVKSVRSVIESCLLQKVPVLTLFAFSSENWARPQKEVQRLMDLFLRALKKEVPELTKQGVKLHFIGDISRLSDKLQNKINEVSKIEPETIKLSLNIAVNYGGKWDIVNASKLMSQDVQYGKMQVTEIEESVFEKYLSLKNKPPVDILVRTGGEHRISNFLLWQLAYAELFFIDTLWPDFRHDEFMKIVETYTNRERRFGKTSEQLNA